MSSSVIPVQIKGITTLSLGHISSLSLCCVHRKYQSYIQAIEDLNHLIFSRGRNMFHQSDTIYSMSSNGRQANNAYRLAHDHTGSVSFFSLPSFIRLSLKRLGMISEADPGSLVLRDVRWIHVGYFPNSRKLRHRVLDAMQWLPGVSHWWY